MLLIYTIVWQNVLVWMLIMHFRANVCRFYLIFKKVSVVNWSLAWYFGMYACYLAQWRKKELAARSLNLTNRLSISLCVVPWSHCLQHSQYAVSKFGENVLVFSCADKSLFIIDGRTSFTTSSFFLLCFRRFA